ncbi:MAG: hypothetical protein A3F67_04130 [Verrucomicrobia bacterium RIFCSPHIGHO2_12_FULL_41_10]|nr:MAG: hypothetical protein A3F67_04130 [Verrucomicrobia bacterium RIFCSPHIGHO2_12_FULL_41_10]
MLSSKAGGWKWHVENHNNIQRIIGASFVTANLSQTGRNSPQKNTKDYTKNTKKEKRIFIKIL